MLASSPHEEVFVAVHMCTQDNTSSKYCELYNGGEFLEWSVEMMDAPYSLAVLDEQGESYFPVILI